MIDRKRVEPAGILLQHLGQNESRLRADRFAPAFIDGIGEACMEHIRTESETNELRPAKAVFEADGISEDRLNRIVGGRGNPHAVPAAADYVVDDLLLGFIESISHGRDQLMIVA